MALRTEVTEVMPSAASRSSAAPTTLVKRLQDRVRELERLPDILSRATYEWETTFDAIQAPVSLISKDFVIQRANLHLARTAQQDITKIIGKKCYKVFAGRSSPCEGCPAAQALERDWQVRNPLKHMVRDREYEVQAYPFAGAKNGEKALVMYYHDVTEERRLQHEIIQQEKMAAIGMLAGGVAHEINNPLGGILAFTQLLIRDHKDNDAIRSDLEEVERSALRCKKIVQDLLDFSRVSSGREKQPVNVNDLLERTFGFLRRELLSLNIALTTELNAQLPSILGDANRLQQVFLNLLTNGIQAMPKGGTLTVRTTAAVDRQSVMVVVSDTGMGIAQEHMRRVFDPFFTTKGPGHGTGLGLSISYRIVKEHGGMLTVESRLGKGALFTVWLPCEDPLTAGGKNDECTYAHRR